MASDIHSDDSFRRGINNINCNMWIQSNLYYDNTQEFTKKCLLKTGACLTLLHSEEPELHKSFSRSKCSKVNTGDINTEKIFKNWNRAIMASFLYQFFQLVFLRFKSGNMHLDYILLLRPWTWCTLGNWFRCCDVAVGPIRLGIAFVELSVFQQKHHQFVNITWK